MIKRIFKIFFALILLILLSITLYLKIELNTLYKGYTGGKIVEIRKGMSVKSTAKLLKAEKIIKSRTLFLLSYKLFFKNKKINAGEFLFKEPMNYQEVIKKITSEYGLLLRLTIKEGDSIFDIADKLENEGIGRKERFLKSSGKLTYLIAEWTNKAKTVEGFIFPDTNKFSKGNTEEIIIKEGINNFKKHFYPLWIKRDKDYKLSIYETIILASLIEKETSSVKEMKIISSVFHNRLKKGMLLQCDPTFIYAIKKDGLWRGKIGYKELKYDSPYNTYLYRGLPPGPICNPGEKAIFAALHPAETNYLFFVSKNDGTHYFSSTLKEHNRAVFNYQIRRR